MKEQFILALNEIIPVLITLVLTGLTYAAKLTTDWLKTKTKSDKTISALTQLNEIVNVVVLEIQQTEVEALRRSLKESGGSEFITRAEAEALANMAIRRVLNYLGDAGVKMIKDALQFDDETLTSYIRSTIEAVVRINKVAIKPAIPTKVLT
jgi:uncharacterized caspase-like protein